MTPMDSYTGKVFCGIFSKNGKTFITASQGKFVQFFVQELDGLNLFNLTIYILYNLQKNKNNAIISAPI